MRMWAPLGRNSNSSHEAANCGYARTTTTYYYVLVVVAKSLEINAYLVISVR